MRPFVSSIVGYDVPGPVPRLHHGLPSTALTVIIAFDEPLRVSWAPDLAHQRFMTMASGFHTGPAYVYAAPRHSGIQLGLTPAGARALFGMPAAELAGQLIELTDVLGPTADRLYHRVAGGAGWDARLTAIDAEFSRLAIAGRVQVRRELGWAWHRLVTGQVRRTITLADEIGWSRTHFARQFAAEFGLRPKETARVARFGRARSALVGPNASLADVAADCGYADQAHLTREWHALSGYTPTQWLAEELSFVQDSPPAH